MAEISDKLLNEIIETLDRCDYRYTDQFPLVTAEIFRGLLMNIIRESVDFDK